MSTRNFARVFRQDVKFTPAGFVKTARIDAARRMLADTKTPVQRVARACGFGNLNTMRRVFISNLGVTPLDYRKSFRSAYSDADATPKPPRRRSDGGSDGDTPKSFPPEAKSEAKSRSGRSIRVPG
jgi:Helix-turn-helix domain